MAYIAALRELYTDFKIDGSWKYFENYADRLSQIAAMYPKDLEAKVFEGLALILAQQPEDVRLKPRLQRPASTWRRRGRNDSQETP
jgi:hypothetical protein